MFELKPHIPLSQWFFYPVFNWDDHLTRRSGYLTSNYRFMARVPKKKCCVKIFHVSGEAENFNASSCSDPSDPRWIYWAIPEFRHWRCIAILWRCGIKEGMGDEYPLPGFFSSPNFKGCWPSLHQFASVCHISLWGTSWWALFCAVVTFLVHSGGFGALSSLRAWYFHQENGEP